MSNEWISVKDRLPKKYGKYLVYIDNDWYVAIKIAWFHQNLYKLDKYDFPEHKRPGWFDYDSEMGHYDVGKVTHWMPLPEPPKEDERE